MNVSSFNTNSPFIAGTYTLPETNIAANGTSQKEVNCPTIDFQGLCCLDIDCLGLIKGGISITSQNLIYKNSFT